MVNHAAFTEDTANLLGIEPDTVKTRLHRARRLVREELDKQIGPVLMDAFPFAGRRCAHDQRRAATAHHFRIIAGNVSALRSSNGRQIHFLLVALVLLPAKRWVAKDVA